MDHGSIPCGGTKSSSCRSISDDSIGYRIGCRFDFSGQKMAKNRTVSDEAEREIPTQSGEAATNGVLTEPRSARSSRPATIWTDTDRGCFQLSYGSAREEHNSNGLRGQLSVRQRRNGPALR